MCYSQHVFHRQCRHWGKDRLDPCIRSRVVGTVHTGCGYIDSLGTVDTNDRCQRCTDSQGRKTPFELLLSLTPQRLSKSCPMI